MKTRIRNLRNMKNKPFLGTIALQSEGTSLYLSERHFRDKVTNCILQIRSRDDIAVNGCNTKQLFRRDRQTRSETLCKNAKYAKNKTKQKK